MPEKYSVELAGACTINNRLYYEFTLSYEQGVFDNFCVDADTGNLVFLHGIAHGAVMLIADSNQQVIEYIAE